MRGGVKSATRFAKESMKKSPVMTLTGPKYPTLERLKGAAGSSGLAIKDAPELAELVLDPATNSLKDDSVFVPMGDRVLVRRIPEAQRTVGGVTLPDTGKTPAAFGVVVGVGQGRYNLVGQLIPIRVQVGAVVMFGKYAGTEIELFGTGGRDGKCVNLREEEIMGVIMPKVAVPENTDPEIAVVSKQ
jgi:chaperonin GroES